jgi:hypothetical protein
MKKIHLALGALGATLLAGCGAPSGEGQVDPDDVAQAARALGAEVAGRDGYHSQLAAADEAAAVGATPPAGPALDARVAASAASEPGGAGAGGTTGTLAGWHTGLLAPGAQQHWHWNNAGTGVYKVGLSPSGATSAGACQFKVIRSWDIQQPGGEREFHFIVQNTGSISCSTNILLQSQAAMTTWSTGTVSVGATQSWTWNNANPLNSAHFVNVSPTGATGSTTCELEVTRSWYVQQPGGEREFRFHVKNVGTLACGGTVLLASNTNANSSWATGTLAPGATASWFWNNANPRNRVYVPGVSPLGATGSSSCQLELLPSAYYEVLNANETSQRRYLIGVKNVGSISCSGTMLLNYLDAAASNPLPVNLAPQQTSMWCWAASGEMVMNYLGGSVSQCNQANQRFNRTDCCDSPTPMACVLGGWPEFEKYGFSSTMVAAALSWDDLKAQIDTKHTPFAFSWHWNSGGGHMMVVTGYKVVGGQNWVTINDPWAPNDGDERDILYTDYVSGSTYTHWRDYYDVSKK